MNNKVLGHQKIRAQFQTFLENQSWPQTLLFYGCDSIGKKQVALEFVANLFCSQKQSSPSLFEEDSHQGACGSCQNCLMVAANKHPDLFFLQPTPPKSKTDKKEYGPADVRSDWTLKVEQVQEVKNKLVHFPLMSDYQVVLVDDAEKMTRTTSNSLLKILEEPRPNQIFILISSQLHRVIPTLRSRCAKFYFKGLDPKDVAAIVQSSVSEKIEPARLEFLARAFQGSILKIQRALESGLDTSLLEPWCVAKNNFMTISENVTEIIQSDVDLALFLQCLRQFKLDKMAAAPELTRADVILFDKIKAAESQLSSHISKEFVLENMAL